MPYRAYILHFAVLWQKEEAICEYLSSLCDLYYTNNIAFSYH